MSVPLNDGSVIPIQMFGIGLHGNASGALLLLAISAFVAALARGFSGFGSALIFVPLASTAIGPQAAAPLLLIIDGVAAAGLIPNAWRHADRRDVGTMSIGALAGIDRKSTRLNSSHQIISYAVFCLKKKTQHRRFSLDANRIAIN